MTDAPPYLSISQAARRWGCAEGTVRARLKDGRLGGLIDGRMFRVCRLCIYDCTDGTVRGAYVQSPSKQCPERRVVGRAR